MSVCEAVRDGFRSANIYRALANPHKKVKGFLWRSIAAPSAPEGWQPIETADKDGTEYLLITKDGRQYVGRFRLGSFGEPQLHEIAWRCSSSGRFSTPVAWRPLPAPPALGGSHD